MRPPHSRRPDASAPASAAAPDPLPPDPAADLPGWAVGYPERRPERETVEVLLHRASSLPREDREILRLAYEEGLSIGRIAAATGSLDPSTTRRRIARLTTRLLSPSFVFVLSQRDRWPATRRRVATEVIIHGRSIRAAALALNTTVHQVRVHRQAVRALFHAASTGGGAP